ncbi:MAG: hypothetical protein KC777_11775 [Cyanobacteria bacterium HKST-UBA02]|nr:hypothetical protein [Cyanobacteria bacterium HKST-UBA02]
MQILLIVMLLVVTLWAPLPVLASGEKSGMRKIRYHGKKRKFLVHVPEDKPDRPLPVVILLHGALTSPRLVQWISRMSQKADSEKFYAVYPASTGGLLSTWNAGECCGPAQKNEVDDIGFLSAVIDKMSTDYQVDPSRIYIAGVSNGGMMAYRAGCELSERVAAIASVEGFMASCHCRPKVPVSVLAINGTEDRVIPIEGGTGRFWGFFPVKVKPASSALEFWLDRNRCLDEPAIEEHGHITKRTFVSPESNTEVCFYTIEGGGHAWPGGRWSFPLSPERRREFSATDEIWEFFKDHSRVSPTATAEAPPR